MRRRAHVKKISLKTQIDLYENTCSHPPLPKHWAESLQNGADVTSRVQDLLSADEPAPVTVELAQGRSPFLLIADHAGNRVPLSLAQLGLPQAELDRHIGIDIGILGVGRGLAQQLGATFIHQPYSRLVIDCNRRPGRPDAMPEISDSTIIPGNLGLDGSARTLREAAIFHPYHARIAAEIDARSAAQRPVVLVALHSFTPKHGDHAAPRPWEIGVLWNRDPRLATALIDVLQAEGGLTIGINEPYGVNDDIDYAIPVHAEARGLPHVEIEIRQDQIAGLAGQRAWAARLARLLPMALARSGVMPDSPGQTKRRSGK
jgi:predicted N-formylglutamate amidohydrolase